MNTENIKNTGTRIELSELNKLFRVFFVKNKTRSVIPDRLGYNFEFSVIELVKRGGYNISNDPGSTKWGDGNRY